jgi:two-component system OmpR family sensor kinase
VGRLFWKFFFFIWLGQLTTIWGVGTAIWILHHNENQARGGINNSPSATFVVQSAAATLQYGGLDALRILLKSKESPPVYAVDEAEHELLGRPILSAAITKARRLLSEDAATSTVKQVLVSGKSYLLFSPIMEGVPPTPGPSRRLFPWFPVLLATIASFLFASLLAWYFFKPIRHLRAAFESVASGNFDVDLNSIMGGRRDDLADLGRDFDRMTGQLRALIEGQRRLLHDISHELRSPLARLQVAIGLARQQPEKLESSMVRIERESMRMDQLVGELLTLSKLDVGVTDSMKETIDPDELLADIVDDAKFEAKAQGKDVELIGKVNACILGSAELLHRAIENVIRNAIKYAPDSSSVTVEAGVEVPLLLKIIIRDSGSGVAETELELIFEPFFRGANRGNNADGHGLGLAIARRVLEAHGGNIHASNCVAGGLCVEMIIPIAGDGVAGTHI